MPPAIIYDNAKITVLNAMVGDQVELGAEDTLQYDPYGVNLQSVEMLTILDEEQEVTPEWGDQYVKSDSLLPRGNIMARGIVVHYKHAMMRWIFLGENYRIGRKHHCRINSC